MDHIRKHLCQALADALCDCATDKEFVDVFVLECGKKNVVVTVGLHDPTATAENSDPYRNHI